jgi:hypothetical protein
MIRGSRNAVVALKRQMRAQQGERDGEKQERRGGIETLAWLVSDVLHALEAGTPWWH